ncbi:ThiF family adenylyltransferase [Hymenobacter sp. DH14]|uniref:ThiF family adenylyltransferase n=1 Tax=Hymenobacter cyanobacteriorum TaxID=2926463 RepID=A0A9X1VMN8_9BACT|nr:ThiF family adenylyltransferase [Hymenobacter cyanobacteriorum]MCI1189890.1 ThiF family adenylyltransferase [Hymenobacter cyanobacteriorum]
MMATTQSPWFEASPHLLQREINALENLNVEFAIDSALQSQGILQLGLVIDPSNPAFRLPAGQEAIQLRAVFPDNYPFFRPEVDALNVELPRHQHPFQKNLCLIPRPSKHWNVEWTLADFLLSQLPKVLEKGAIVDAALLAADPAEHAEPASSYYGGAAVVFDSSSFDALVTADADLAMLGRIQVGFSKQRVLPARSAVLHSTIDRQVVSPLPAVFQELFPFKFDGYALRLSERPPFGDPNQDIGWLRKLLEKHNGGMVPRSKPLPGFKGDVTLDGQTINGNLTITDFWGLNIPEEVGPGVLGMGWLFLLEGFMEVTVPQGKNKSVKQKLPFASYAQAARSGPQDIQIRVPALKGLPAYTVAVVGLGALGAPAAIEFARNQVGGLRLMDFDSVDPGTTVRWPLGIPAFGQQKTEALRDFIGDNYPRTAVQALEHRIGQKPVPGKPNEQQLMNDLLDGVSLLFDASAEIGINNFLSEEAKRRGIPYISLYATPGAWGGLVMRVVPGKTPGCWMCLQYAKDNTIPIPRSDAHGDVQAPGCGDITFTGASFDLQNVTLAAVRLAVSTLCAGTEGGYPDVSWDVGVVNFVDANHLPIPPTWETFPLSIHPDCPYCSKS